MMEQEWAVYSFNYPLIFSYILHDKCGRVHESTCLFDFNVLYLYLLIIYVKIKLKLQTRHYVNEFVHKSINFL